MYINPRVKPRARRNWSQMARRVTQGGFLVFILVASIRHNLASVDGTTASIDALCPFGGLETLWQMILNGTYIPKTHPSNIVLGIGLLVSALIAGAAFCGWICPFGTLQDLLTGLRKRLHLREVRIPTRIDGWLRYGRFLVLALILFKTISTVKLWFTGYDPYRTIFSLGWLFEFNLAENWPAYLVALIVLLATFWVPRAWCKYACPLGGALSLLSYFSFLRIQRSATACKTCNVCDKPCPVGLAVAKASPRVSTNCIGCLACVEACPRVGALDVAIAPVWWDQLRALPKRFRREPVPASGD